MLNWAKQHCDQSTKMPKTGLRIGDAVSGWLQTSAEAASVLWVEIAPYPLFPVPKIDVTGDKVSRAAGVGWGGCPGTVTALLYRGTSYQQQSRIFLSSLVQIEHSHPHHSYESLLAGIPLIYVVPIWHCAQCQNWERPQRQCRVVWRRGGGGMHGHVSHLASIPASSVIR